jgi:hypothetical protein
MKKHSDPGPDPETMKNQDSQKVKTLDPERAIAIRAARSLRQAREKWSKMNREYPANLDDHIALERLLAAERGTNGFFIEGALIIEFDHQISNFKYCGGLTLPPAFRYLQSRYRIILAPAKNPLTIRDGEELLEKQKISDREAEEFQKELDKFQDKWFEKKMDDSDHLPDGITQEE